MRNRKIGLMVLAVLIATALFTTSVRAADGFYTCAVKGAGPKNDGSVYILLSDTKGQFPDQWFRAVSGQESRQLATALTAMTNGWNVIIYTDPTLTGENRIVKIIYVYK